MIEVKPLIDTAIAFMNLKALCGHDITEDKKKIDDLLSEFGGVRV